ncbi:MAG: type I DNA topoisomerase [Candidatus Aminicenantales bacterium]
MPKSLVIVESPAKAQTINRYLGSSYLVRASMGHVRDLPKSGLGVEVENNFSPRYVILPERKKLVADLQKLAADCAAVILAADPDREGEAICWHLSELLAKSNPNIRRVLLHEITKKAVEEAFQNLGHLDQNKINAQQTRRILDRLVGYLISPLLWRKIGQGLSAGRVQSIALRLICEREKDIRNFVPEEYWVIAARLEAAVPPIFRATLAKIDGKKAKITNETMASEVVAELKTATYVLEDVRIKQKKRQPNPPYITSTLQQDSFRLLQFPVRKTMSISQRLYEGLPIGERGPVGLITYMRTDSVRVSDSAIEWARKVIEANFSKAHVPPKPRLFKNKRKAQDAHEAIRPTSPDLPPQVVKPYLKKEEFDLYNLIWNRFLASQMSAADVEETEFLIRAGRYELRAKGEVIRFEGFLALFPNSKKEKEEEERLPRAEKGETLRLLDLESKQNFTQPPPRYTEGTLVKELEAKGIGRPSTYAPIIATLQDRIYVVKEKGKFVPTDLGLFVTDFLIAHFPDLMEVRFTARMEEELDRISEGEQDWLASLRRYYELLKEDLAKAGEVQAVKGIPVEEKCPRCGRPLLIKDGRFGRFKACSGFPECTYKESLTKKDTVNLEELCPKCGSPLQEKNGKYGKFVACSNYPRCRYIKKAKPERVDTGLACPLGCGGTILRRATKWGKIFYGCSRFPKCRFATWDEPVPQSCPRCGRPFLLRKTRKDGTTLSCWDKKCGYPEEVKKIKENEKDETRT